MIARHKYRLPYRGCATLPVRLPGRDNSFWLPTPKKSSSPSVDHRHSFFRTATPRPFELGTSLSLSRIGWGCRVAHRSDANGGLTTADKQGGCTWYVKSVKRKNGIGRSGVEPVEEACGRGREEGEAEEAGFAFVQVSPDPESRLSVRPSVRPSDRVTKRRAPVVRLTVRPFVAARTGWHWMAWHSWQARHAAVRSFVRSFVRSSDGSLQLPPIPPISTPPSFYPAELSR